MARETKFGLLIGLVVILLFGLLVSDYLRPVEDRVDAVDPTRLAQGAQDSIDPLGARRAPAMPRFDEAMYGRPGDALGVVVQPIPAAGPEPEPVWMPSPADTPAGGEARPPVFGEPPPVEHRQAWVVVDRDEAFRAAMQRVGTLPEPTRPGAADLPRHIDSTTPTPTPAPAVAPPAPAPATAQEPVRAAPTPAPAPAGAIVHEVREGDTLTAVARRYYGDDRLWRTVADANLDKLMPGYRLRPGTRLTVPPLPPAFTPEMAEHFEIVATQRRPPADAVTLVATHAPRADGPAPPPMTPVVTVRVASGDTLIRLASRHLGDGDRWQELLDANRDQLARPEQLHEGMTLKMPADAATTSTTAAAAEPAGRVAPALTPPREKTYTVQGGDNLTRIARKTLGDDDAWRRIYDANRDRLTSPDAVVPGQTLRIPAD